MQKLFIDTSAFAALADSRDDNVFLRNFQFLGTLVF
jgi:predicted nucleic acid-binding protein